MVKAMLVEVKSDGTNEEVTDGHKVKVHFNPQSLKVRYVNNNTTGTQPLGGVKQNAGALTANLSFELLFDTTATGEDVRTFVRDLTYFIQPLPADKRSGAAASDHPKTDPPRVRFDWGTFVFAGTMESLDETLDYFGEDGTPMRATVQVSIASESTKILDRQPGSATAGGGGGIGAGAGAGFGGGASESAGVTAMAGVQAGASIQAMAGGVGASGSWKAIASANGIDNPLRLDAGSSLDLSARASASATAGAGFSAGINGSASLSGGARLSGGASLSAGASAGGSASFGP